MPAPFIEAALLVPLYIETEQFGAILLGRPVNGIKFSYNNVDKLLYPGDQIAKVISDSQKELECFRKAAGSSINNDSQLLEKDILVTTKEVERALKHISDYAFLGDSSLVKLKLVKARFP